MPSKKRKIEHSSSDEDYSASEGSNEAISSKAKKAKAKKPAPPEKSYKQSEKTRKYGREWYEKNKERKLDQRKAKVYKHPEIPGVSINQNQKTHLRRQKIIVTTTDEVMRLRDFEKENSRRSKEGDALLKIKKTTLTQEELETLLAEKFKKKNEQKHKQSKNVRMIKFINDDGVTEELNGKAFRERNRRRAKAGKDLFIELNDEEKSSDELERILPAHISEKEEERLDSDASTEAEEGQQANNPFRLFTQIDKYTIEESEHPFDLDRDPPNSP